MYKIDVVTIEKIKTTKNCHVKNHSFYRSKSLFIKSLSTLFDFKLLEKPINTNPRKSPRLPAVIVGYLSSSDYKNSKTIVWHKNKIRIDMKKDRDFNH